MLARLAEVARTGEGNLLAAAVDAARAKATVGEISLALEKVWNRHAAGDPRGARASMPQRRATSTRSSTAKHAVAAFREADGRRAADPRRQDRPGWP